MMNRSALSAKTLGQIALVQSMIPHIAEQEEVMRFTCRGLEEVPGIARIEYNSNQVQLDLSKKPTKYTIRTIDIQHGDIFYSRIQFNLDDEAAFLPYLPFVENLTSMLSVFFEERRQRELNEAILKGLEKRVSQRTKSLEAEIIQRQAIETQLKTSEERFSKSFQSSSIGIAITGLKGHFTLVNPALCALFQYSEEELLQMTFAEVTHPEDSAKSLEYLNQLVENKIDSFEDEKRYLKKDGGYFWASVKVDGVRDDDGHLLHFFTHIMDITQAKRANEALRAEKEFIEVSLNAQQDTFFVFDPATARAVRWNKTFSSISGYSDEEITHLPAPETYYNAEDLQLAGEFIERLLQGEKETIELNLVCKDGRSIPTEYNAAVIKDEDHNPKFIIALGRDISDRKRVEEALEKRIIALTQPLGEAESIDFEDLFNLSEIQQLQDEFSAATGVASIITKVDGTPITKASNFCRLCSDIVRGTEKGLKNCYHSDAVLGSPNPEGPTIQRCMSGGLWDAGAAISVDGKHIANWLIGQVRDQSQTEEQMKLYAREIGADETEILEALTEVPAMEFEQFKNIAQVLSTLARQLSDTAYQNVRQARFIAERKQNEEDRLALVKQLHQAQKLEAVGTMVGGISHELNNVLQSVFLYTELIQDILPPDDQLQENFGLLLKEGNRAREIVKQILTFSRRTKIDLKPRTIHNIISDILHLQRASLPPTIEIRQNLDSRCGLVNCDETQLHQLVLNLCNNANQAMGEAGGILEVNLQPSKAILNEIEQSVVMLEVSDTGVGMDEEVMARIFDPFFTTKDIGKGTGLGLSVIHGIVEMMGGTIEVSSKPGEGTRFKIYLPRSTEIEIPKTSETESTASVSNLSVLLADDEESIRKSTKKILMRDGFQIDLAQDGEEALLLFKQNPEKYDLVVTDLSMPNMSGIDLTQEIRKTDKKIPILLSTGHMELEDEHTYSNSGISHFIQKPWTAIELRKKIIQIFK